MATSETANTFFVPGEAIDEALHWIDEEEIRIGDGLEEVGGRLRATVAGALRGDGRSVPLHIQAASRRRYTAAREDAVVGIVRERHADGFRVDVGGGELANLAALAFQGASKRNRPQLAIGSVVFARVVFAHRDMEPEISCVEEGSVKSWVTGEALYGELKGGQLIRVPLHFARALLHPTGTTRMTELGREVAFESVVGVNGWIWIRAESCQDTVRVAAALSAAVVPH
mmetsp:Transcript_11401/g.23077  ORF Transcript_11401/g.23077 Transcript_11401/m.23077 type:complete len:228 (+) Transcript_11401:3146-3829(+)